ncbi:MAG: IgGFc-binding protein [Kofleriaceae bacterium]
MRALEHLGLPLVFLLAGACGPQARQSEPDACVGTACPACTPGQTRCDGDALQTCGDDGWATTTECPLACDPGYGCVACVPGTGTCTGDISTVCREDGSRYDDVLCDPVQGMTCGASGLCEGACSPAALGASYFGCDYWPTITGNPVVNSFDFAVVVANSSDLPSDVTIEGGALGSALSFTVPAGASVVRQLPWVAALKLCNGSFSSECTGGGRPTGARVNGGAYHLRTTAPVTVYQFNPLQYTEGGGTLSFTNDASLLFPSTAWGDDHYAVAWNTLQGVHPSLLTITAAHAGTQVTVTPAADTAASQGAPALTRGVPQLITLDAGDVVQLGTLTGDLTGSRVESDKPVQVIGGHYCANIPDNMGYCDHLEDLMLPVDALGADYVINAPAVTTIPNGKVQMVRIVATEANTHLGYDPPQAGAPVLIAAAGEWVQLSNTNASFRLTADKKIVVGQFMEGSTVAGGTGDPSMAVAVPVDQFRSDYLFHAPINYTTNYVDITAPVGASVTLDGSPIASWTPIGSTGWQLARVTPLLAGPGNDGNHRIIGTTPFGISVYGYGQDTSYWYPGGLDLARVIVE